MYIKSIVLDGFKSYGQRTEINGFDKEFNAITGLNGTGKSNILDSICFVLGISNLSHVRAGSLQDLIYRSGQAGVVKATVSITFDNSNKNQSPLGFEDCREITVTRQVIMGGKNKYILNGLVVQNKRVQDLFCSVQLNVNNPHFLIMQGRITKVLNMKPPEILAMVEEAAGTRMYELKRQAAMKNIEKKDAKLAELEKINKEEIAPKLERLRAERASYIEYQHIERELEHMTGIFQAWQFYATQRCCKEAEKDLEEGQNKMQKIHDNIKEHKLVIKEIDAEVEEMMSNLQSSGGGKIQELEAELKLNEKSEAKACALEKSSKDKITVEEKKIKQLEKNLKDDEMALKSKEEELEKVQNLFQSLKETDASDNEAYALAQRKYEAVSVGMELNDAGESETLQDQLMNAKQQATEANTEIKQATMQINHLQTQLKERRRRSGSGAVDYEKDKATLANIEKEVQALEKSLSKLNYSDDRMNELRGRRHALVNEIRGLEEKIDRFQTRNSYTNFHYDDPEPNFDRRRVKGVVCRIIKLKNPSTAIAIETAAGGRLYNVVVDTDVVSKKLLERGNLQNRTTFIPLNKIQGGKIENNMINIAQGLVGKENVQSALSLVNYDKQLQKAMEFVLGNVFICKDLNVAKEIAFHDRIRRKCVTLEGDVVDPSGILSGGAQKQEASVLIQLQEIQQYEEQLEGKRRELAEIEKEVKQMSGVQEQWSSMTQRLELRQHELLLVRKRLQQTTHHQEQEETDNMQQKLVELNEKIKTSKALEIECNNKAKELQLKMKDVKGHQERLLKNAENEMKRLKKKADASKQNWKQHEQEYETLNLEISELKQGLENIKQQIVETEENLVKFKELLIEQHNDVLEKKEIVSKLQQSYKTEKEAIADKNKGIQKKVHRKEKLMQQISEFELEIKKHEHEIQKLQDDFKASKKRQAEYSKKAKNNDANLREAEKLSDKDARDLEKKIRTGQDKRVELKRTINTKAQSMFDYEEKQYNHLLKRKKIVENDKQKLLTVMKDLDVKKEEAIVLAWQQVSKDFGSIFGTLLPGSNAKLQPANENVMEGLEVKIFLGGVWKESLSELSGGQRSLVALSLILAMLLFKPAPLYILDEVDAALDLSHTQNIGNMLKSHFKQSQFIIVSLKNGMFNNANVLFQTKFVDGVSAVTRIANQNR